MPRNRVAQYRIIAKINEYLLHKAAKSQHPGVVQESELPAVSNEGICSGLAAYWLYSKRIGEEKRFWYQIRQLLNWDALAFAESTAKEDPFLEQLISIIIFLDYDGKLREQYVQQDALDISTAIIFGPNAPQIAKPEFKITFVFDQQTLSSLINNIKRPYKMIRIENGFHAIGLMFQNNKFYLYNSEISHGVLFLKNSDSVAKAIFKSLCGFCHSTTHIALHISIFDLVDSELGSYPVAMEYMQQLMQDQQYKTAVIQHPNIFNLAARYANYPLLDLLFASGYEYLPWQYNEATELNLAVHEDDETKVKYLIAHGFPVNYQPINDAITAVATAIIHHRTKMLFILLAAGADPNVPPVVGWSAVGLANQFDNLEALILLLAYGLDVDRETLNEIQLKYPHTNKLIFEHAIELNAKILGEPTKFNVAESNPEQIQTYFRQHKVLSFSKSDIQQPAISYSAALPLLTI